MNALWKVTSGDLKVHGFQLEEDLEERGRSFSFGVSEKIWKIL